jgi:DNA ligase D-like protein (predicted 3'-phosphoesterase)
MGLELYRKKRNFKTTPEPAGRVRRSHAHEPVFVIQKHAASHLHYDFRLELNGVLLSWAVPKGPSLDPHDKCLAMHVEDHPIEYGDFEGVIPPKQYGSGTVLLWDRGTWTPQGDAEAAYHQGKLKFELHGEKLQGGWMLVKSHGGKYDGDKSWLLIKENDDYARSGADAHIVDTEPDSVASGRSIEAIAADPDRVWHSNKSVADASRRYRRRRSTARARPRNPRRWTPSSRRWSIIRHRVTNGCTRSSSTATGCCRASPTAGAASSRATARTGPRRSRPSSMRSSGCP